MLTIRHQSLKECVQHLFVLLISVWILLTTAPASASLSASTPIGAESHPSTHTAILKKIESIYQPFAKREGGVLAIEINTQDPLASASAHRDTLTEFKVRLAGGLMSHANITDDVLRFTICHELGHLFGGHPHRPAPMEWPGPFDENSDMILAAEAQADYYATLKCMRLTLADEDNIAAVSQVLIDPVVRKECDYAHSRPEDSAICQRAVMAGFGMLTLNFPFKIAFDTPAQEIAPATINGTYPTRQCRLDTILAGALCSKDPNSSDHNECSSSEGDVGFRPACWFKE